MPIHPPPMLRLEVGVFSAKKDKQHNHSRKAVANAVATFFPYISYQKLPYCMKMHGTIVNFIQKNILIPTHMAFLDKRNSSAS